MFGLYWATTAQRCPLFRISLYNPSINFQLLQIAFLGRCDLHCDALNTTEGTVSSLRSLGLCYYIARQRDANKSTEGLKWISVLSYERDRGWELGCGVPCFCDDRVAADSSDVKDNSSPKKNWFHTWFQASATAYDIFALLWCYSAFICSYRRFWKHRYDFQGLVQATCLDSLTVGRWNRQVVPKLPRYSCRVQTGTVHLYIAGLIVQLYSTYQYYTAVHCRSVLYSSTIQIGTVQLYTAGLAVQLYSTDRYSTAVHYRSVLYSCTLQVSL